MRLDGLEHLILVELCLKYNCTLTARLDYDEELWGDIYDNKTGYGLLGAIAMYQANVTCSSLTLWHSTYKFTQYSAQLQRASVTNIVSVSLIQLRNINLDLLGTETFAITILEDSNSSISWLYLGLCNWFVINLCCDFVHHKFYSNKNEEGTPWNNRGKGI